MLARHMFNHIAPSLGRTFCRDRRGNFSLLFALVLIPLVGAVGIAIDYGLMSDRRTHIDQSLDAALSLGVQEARRLLNTGEPGDVAIPAGTRLARDHFRERMSQSGDADATETDGHLVVRIRANRHRVWGHSRYTTTIEPTFSKLIGAQTVPIDRRTRFNTAR